MTSFRYSEDEWAMVVGVVKDHERLSDLRKFLEDEVSFAAWRMADAVNSVDRDHFGMLARTLDAAVLKIDLAIDECTRNFLEHASLEGTDFDDLRAAREVIEAKARHCERRARPRAFWGEDKGGRHRPRRNYIIEMVLDAWCGTLGRTVPAGGGSATSEVAVFVVRAANPILRHELGDGEIIAAGNTKGSDGKMRFGATGLKDIIRGYAEAQSARNSPDGEVSEGC